jgi:hypothetical protein
VQNNIGRRVICDVRLHGLSPGPSMIVAHGDSPSRSRRIAHTPRHMDYSTLDVRMKLLTPLLCSPKSSLMDAKSTANCWFALSESSCNAARWTIIGTTDETSVKSSRSSRPALNTSRRRLFQPTSSSPALRLFSDSPAQLRLTLGRHGSHR